MVGTAGRALSVLAAVCLAACAGEPRDLTWRARFSIPSSGASARGARATIIEGGCGAGEQVWTDFIDRAAMSGAAPPELPPGRYGFRVEATDASCRVIASGCTELDTPSPISQEILVVLQPTSISTFVCASGICVNGRCLEPDAGPDSSVHDATSDVVIITPPGGDCTTDSQCGSYTDCSYPSCVAGRCRITVNGAACDDFNPCTDDECNPSAGCTHRGGGACPDDGIFCNGSEYCTDSGCGHSGPPCSGLTCDEVRDQCGCSSNAECDPPLQCIGGACQCASGLERCDNAIDDDCDAWIDCDDPDCASMRCGTRGEICVGGTCTCEVSDTPERDCSDGMDNDCDSVTDCQDEDCDGLDCGSGSICSGGTCRSCEVTDCYCPAIPCTSGKYCDYATSCSGVASCVTRPTTCSALLSRVCGCNNVTYDNACLANMAGVDVRYAGICPVP